MSAPMSVMRVGMEVSSDFSRCFSGPARVIHDQPKMASAATIAPIQKEMNGSLISRRGPIQNERVGSLMERSKGNETVHAGARRKRCSQKWGMRIYKSTLTYIWRIP